MFAIYAIIFVGVLLIVLAFLQRRAIRRYLRLWELSKQFPGPPCVPIFGNAYIFINVSAVQTTKLVLNLFEKYGSTVKLWYCNDFSIMTSDLGDIEIVLANSQFLEKSTEYELLAPWLHEGLLVSKGPKWFKRRKILTPAFHFGILEQFIEVFDRDSRQFVNNVRSAALYSDNVDLAHWISLATLDVICESAMGVSINAQTNADSDYVRAVKTISTVLHKRMFDLLYRFDITYKFTQLARDEKKALAVLHGFTEKIIMQRRDEVLAKQNAAATSETKKTEDEDVGARRKMAFLDILLQSEIDGKPLTNLDIREEVDTFMFEGHDTTSSAITFLFYNLALYPESQKKCFEEVRSIFGDDKTTPVSYDELNKLHYVDLCIKETLRMFPSVPLLGRKVTQECVINGKTIPAGTNIGISPLHLGRQEDLFPDPNTFKPERFDVVTSAEKMNPYAYIPFSAGPRNCIGQKFAMFEIKTVAANILRHFSIEYAGDPTVEPLLVGELILRTRDPLMFKIKPREY